jgi:hypothetical protein
MSRNTDSIHEAGLSSREATRIITQSCLYFVTVNNNQSQYLFSYSKHMPLCLLPIKSPPDFSCSLKVSHKALLISYEVKSTIIIVPSHGQNCLYNFCHVNFLFYASFVLTANKATVIFRSGMNCHKKHYSLLAVKSVSFSHHINSFSGRIFTNLGQLLRLLTCKLLHTHEGTDVLPVYRHILITANTTVSQKSEDCDITDKFP